ncbi:MAG: cytochrome c3 family protein [Phycisphaerae bacterium]|nr:cytochrome c3 family protein [Phycisphaerae bacterium]
MSTRVTPNPYKRSIVMSVRQACCLALIVGVPSATFGQPTQVSEPASTKQTASVTGQSEGAARSGDTQKDSSSPAESNESDCRRCHSCDNPTPADKCLLHACTRNEPRKQDAGVQDQGPDVVILNELEDAYLPVPFDHEGHAQMAQMAKGCVTCHHHTPEGWRHPACKTCHDTSVAGTDIYKPGLKGAYHQQCLNCHRDWIDEKDCVKCHVPKAGRPKGSDAATPLSKDDILGRLHPLGQMHPPIPEPDTVSYRPESKRAEGSRVTFRHREHVHRFGLSCASCHHESNCTRCHAPEAAQKRPPTSTEPHMPCIRCHTSDMGEPTGRIVRKCKRCHWQEGEPEPKPFDHAVTGWPLGSFHEGAGCRDCHTNPPFAKLNNDCNACHGNWSPSTFNHRVTGQVLDENHAEHDCEMCHADSRFDRPPTCSECHNEKDDGISFPTRRPGPQVPRGP